MKLYRRVPRSRRPKGWCAKKLRWAATLKPGDLIAACTGFNVEIATIKREVWQYRTGWVLDDFRVIDTVGRQHSIMYCCTKAETIEQIESYFKNWKDDNHYGEMPRIVQALMDGNKICNEQGIILPEFQKNYKD